MEPTNSGRRDPPTSQYRKNESSSGSPGSSSSLGDSSKSDASKNRQHNNNHARSNMPWINLGKLSPMRDQNQKNQPSSNAVSNGGFFDNAAMSTEVTQQQERRPNNNSHHSSNSSSNSNSISNHQRSNNDHSPKRSPNRNIRLNPPKAEKEPSAMTVICNRVSLYDCASKKHHYDGADDDMPQGSNLPHPNLPVAPYHFASDDTTAANATPIVHQSSRTVAIVRAPRHAIKLTASQQFMPVQDAIDKSIPNPHPAKICHDKYWAQRRRLFSKFDMGIQLDAEGWYSVTPEVVANHVAQRVGALSYSAAFRRPPSQPRGIILLEAFCGCGGNAIAFGKIPAHEISLVVCVDIDRSKLRKAAYNACLYEIPKEKLIFVECSSPFILEHCYQDGVLCIDRLRNSGAKLPKMAETEVCAGFFIGGMGMLPQRIDAVFMDPPWGGVDYNSLGKNGYCLEKHMKIKLGPNPYAPIADEPKLAAGDADDFFDSFGPVSSKQTKKKFNQKEDESEYWNGVDLLKVAASATKSRLVIYDMPRNTSKISLGRCALAAGYRGNLKLEEHFLNGRLKTVTAYMGADYSPMLHQNSGSDSDQPAAALPERLT